MNRVYLWLSDRLSWLRFPTASFSISDVFEILILAFLVYELLLWIKNTRAWTLLKGILTIVVFVSLVYILEMDTLIYIGDHCSSGCVPAGNSEGSGTVGGKAFYL